MHYSEAISSINVLYGRATGNVRVLPVKRSSESLMSDKPHPDVQTVLSSLAGQPSYSSLSVEGVRKLAADQTAATPVNESDPEPVGMIRDLLISGPDESIPIRVYEPTGEGPFPLLIWIHGGGWIRGDLDMDDDWCRTFANEVNCVVVAVDYRLAPETPFPGPLKDCYAAATWAQKHADVLNGDPNRLAIAGESSGGNLAAAVTLMAQDRDAPSFCFQLLALPITNHSFDTPSYIEKAENYGLTRTDMQWCWEQYLRDDIDGSHPYASPLQARDLSDIPPTTVMTAEFDPVQDDGRQYAERLETAGVSVTHRDYAGMYHGFLTDPKPYAKAAMDDMIVDFRHAFGE